MGRYAETEQQHTSSVYPKRDVTIVRGEGMWLWDDRGRRYLDCVGGHGVAALGHAHPAIAEAVAEQARRLITCPEVFYNDRRAELYAALSEVTPPGLDRFFLCNSGAEAVEAALKFARLSSGRREIVATMRGFHGRTMGALSATWNKRYREPFAPLVPGFSHVPFDNLVKMEEAVTEKTAAVLVEIVQGEGGVRSGSAAYFRGLRRLCDERGALLIVDEVQTGFGRTGRWFACQHHDIVPDLMTMAKAMAGGLPMGGVAIGPRVTGLWPGAHGTTFGGNPLACAAALATIGVMRTEDLPAQAAEKGTYLLERLRRIESPQVREVRGLGLMVGIELKGRVTPVLRKLMAHGVLALPAGATVLRLLPPLVISYDELDEVAEVIEMVLDK
ncbi:MAG: aspartate aminotransferase family protein [Chloroflexi bacterium]|nr:aspartate aminotransferase family protein [Chloroflexota bacterium]